MVKKIAKGVTAMAMLLVLLVFLKIQFIGKAFDAKAFEPYLQKDINSSGIQLTFLGTSGFIIDYKGRQVVCDPYFSNPNLISTAFGKIHYPTISNYIDSSLYQNVSLITISHGHYDHCGDIDNFLHRGNNTVVYTDKGILNMLSPLFTGKGTRQIPINYENKSWAYSEDSTFRAFPLESIHSPHFANITLFTGQYDKPQTQLPAKLWDWKLCVCNSYLIDVMKDNEIAYRVLMCCGNMNETGFEDLQKHSAERKADLLLHIFWKNKECKENLEGVYAIAKPKHVILHHWNNFFRDIDKPIQQLRSCEFPGSIDDLQAEGIDGKLMIPFSTVKL